MQSKQYENVIAGVVSKLGNPANDHNGPAARLYPVVKQGSNTVLFELHFAAPSGVPDAICAEAWLELGDGARLALENLCAPTRDTWSTGHTRAVVEYTYAEEGIYDATLIWGDLTLEATVDFEVDGMISVQQWPTVAQFSIASAEDWPLERVVTVAVTELAPGQSLRVDGGAGNIRWWTPPDPGKSIADDPAEWRFGYAKPGSYVVRIDLLDRDGFWLTTLEKVAIEIESPLDDVAVVGADTDDELVADLTDVAYDSAANVPWLPFRYVRPMWSWARTYTQAGGSVVSRILGLGTYLAVRQEVTIGGQIWYQTGNFDWIPAASVALIKPSELRGVELSAADPDPGPDPGPEPEPEPTLNVRGTVTANVLNVRAGPGVQQPIVDQIRFGTIVQIDAEANVAGAVWYRIGSERWVHSGWIRLLDPEPEPNPDPPRQGIVTAYALTVRARPGTGNPPIDRLLRGEQVTIYAQTEVERALWYRIGIDRWVHSAWVRVVSSTLELGQPFDKSGPFTPSRAATKITLPVGWVVTSSLHIRSLPGVGADSEIVGLLEHNQSMPILGETLVAGQKWYQIGPGQWIFGASVGVARHRARPSSLGATERWVGVNLREQTAVAYEDDKPVYAALVATGLPATPTVQGLFRTWLRLVSRKMSGGSPATGGYYYLEEVPWTCYFYSGYALHAAYWHDAFGRPRSHGCVNLSPYDAWWIFQWSTPGGSNSPAVYVYWE